MAVPIFIPRNNVVRSPITSPVPVGQGGSSLSSTTGAASSTTTAPAPVVLNAGTTYGNNLDVANAYGVGSTFQSTAMVNDASIAAKATPSVWWLVGAIVLIAVLA